MGIGIMNSGFLFDNSSSSSSGMNNYSWLSEYNNIRSGTYYKVLKAYYAKNSSADKSSTVSSDKDYSKTASSEAKTLDQIQVDAKSLSSAADALITKGTDSLFKQKDITVKGEDGTETTTKGYDTGAIYDAVKKFADSYNTLLDSASSSDSTSILRTALNMTNMTKSYSKLLSSVGITIAEDNKLNVDETKFKESDMSTVKTLFNGNTSYAYNAATKASMLNISASSEANKDKLYTSSGQYNNTYSTGNLMNSIF